MGFIELYACRAQWWSHPLVVAGSDERLALTGRRIQDVQYAVFGRFSPAATSWFNRDDAISSNAAAKGCQLPGKCCNKVKNKASPHLIPMCEFVHTVKKREVGKNPNTFYNDSITDNTVDLHRCSTDLWKMVKWDTKYFYSPSICPKSETSLSGEWHVIPLFSLAAVSVALNVCTWQLLSQSGLAQVKLIHSTILSLLLLCAPYLSLI